MKIYAIEGMTVSFNSYEEAELFRKHYNKQYYPDYYEPWTVKAYNLFDKCADAIDWGKDKADR